jgi:argininosuccinate lyase
VVALSVRYAEGRGVDLADLSLDELQTVQPADRAGHLPGTDPEGSLAQRDHVGGTAPNQVRAQIARHKARLAS